MPTEPAISANGASEHTLPPFLRRVRLRGFKSIGFCDVRLHPLTILVGRNAAGKSNFLDALAFLRDVMTLGVGEAVKSRGGWNAVASRSTNPPVIEIEVEADYVCGRPVQRIQIDNGNSDLPSAAPVPNLEGHRFSARYSLQIAGGRNTPPVIRRETLDLTDEATHEKGGFDLQRHLPPPPLQGAGKKTEDSSSAAMRMFCTGKAATSGLMLPGRPSARCPRSDPTFASWP